MTTISNEDLQEIAYLADLDPEAARTSYSGRGMYGKRCVGFVVEDRVNGILALGAALNAVLGELPDASWDGMGLGTIIYFPSLQAEEDEDEAEPLDDEDDDS